MIDKYGREIDYLRISLTDRCNLRCIYCMPEEGVKSLSHAEILTYDEILRICRCAADLGIRKIKLTGGEPLVRKGCASLAKQIKAIPGIEKVTLTTNGILLAEQLEDVLENHTIVLYSLDSWKRFGRMEMSSPEIRRKMPNSIRIEEYQNAIETLEKGEVWRNRELLAGYPAYIAGIKRNEELVMLVFIQDAASNQMTLYYLNLIKILCGLVEVSLLRALEYQEAVRDREYLEGTHILKTEYFMERLKLFHSIKEQKIGSYALLQIENPEVTLEETDRILKNKIRENDILGISEDGQLYLILSQVDDAMLPIVIERLEKNGLHCRVIDTRNESRVAEE